MTARADQKGPVEFRIPVPKIPEPPSPRVAELATNQVVLPRQLLAHLEANKIRTLADIRNAGGLRNMEGLPVPTDHPSVRNLEAHADLNRVSANLELNTELIKRGFASVSTIARSPRMDFVAVAHPFVGDFSAAKMHVESHAETDFLGNVIVGMMPKVANGRPIGLPDFEPEMDHPDLFLPKCGCRNCEAAVSPLAYLADLLDYAVRHLKDGGTPVTLAGLDSKFHQDFSNLTSSCRELQNQVRQVRVCIEVLRSHLAESGIPAPGTIEETSLSAAQADYLVSTYQGILTRIGTSYEEIRLAQTADEQEQGQLADRLGIVTNHVEKLLLDPDAESNEVEPLTEETLEILFGLPDTTRDPLSVGEKRGDYLDQIKRWTLTGIAWNRNTGVEGKVYLSLKNPAADVF